MNKKIIKLIAGVMFQIFLFSVVCFALTQDEKLSKSGENSISKGDYVAQEGKQPNEIPEDKMTISSDFQKNDSEKVTLSSVIDNMGDASVNTKVSTLKGIGATTGEITTVLIGKGEDPSEVADSLIASGESPETVKDFIGNLGDYKQTSTAKVVQTASVKEYDSIGDIWGSNDGTTGAEKIKNAYAIAGSLIKDELQESKREIKQAKNSYNHAVSWAKDKKAEDLAAAKEEYLKTGDAAKYNAAKQKAQRSYLNTVMQAQDKLSNDYEAIESSFKDFTNDVFNELENPGAYKFKENEPEIRRAMNLKLKNQVQEQQEAFSAYAKKITEVREKMMSTVNRTN
jgi:hypothetical protein